MRGPAHMAVNLTSGSHSLGEVMPNAAPDAPTQPYITIASPKIYLCLTGAPAGQYLPAQGRPSR
jgi:hypothetical protein